jgi:hypothetical protein
MSLNWDITNVTDNEAICFYRDSDGDRCLKQQTQNLLFLTMVVGMNSINERNYKEFYTRVALYERLRGAVMTVLNDEGKWVDDPYTLEDIRQHIGLWTNASNETATAWRKRILGSWEHDLLIERLH